MLLFACYFWFRWLRPKGIMQFPSSGDWKGKKKKQAPLERTHSKALEWVLSNKQQQQQQEPNHHQTLLSEK